MQNRIESAVRYLHRYRYTFLAGFLLIGIIYFPKLSQDSYSIDTERMIRFPDYTLNWWLRLGRFGLVALTKIPIFGSGIHIRYINFLTYIFLAFVILILVKVFDPKGVRNQFEQFIAIGLFVSTPVILEQTNFVLQSSPVMFATGLMILGYGFLKRYLLTKNLLYLFFGIVIEAFSFSVYVSLVMGFIILVIMDLCYQSLLENWTYKRYFLTAIYMAVSSVVSYLIYLLLNRLILRIMGLKQSNYLSESRLWGNVPNDQVLETIKTTLKSSFSFDSPLALWGTLTLTILFLLISIINLKRIWITIITFFGVVAICTYTVPTLGYFGTIRSYFPIYSIVLYGLALIIFQSINSIPVKIFIGIAMLGIISIQALNTIKFEINEQNLYNQEIAFVNEIKEKLDELNITDYSKCKLALIGGRTFEQSIHGDMLGNSVFTFEINGEVGISKRAGDFMYNQGLNFRNIKPNEFAKAFGQSVNMEIFPNENSIEVVGDIVVIRLS